jgi:uncharacterized membrane protein (DUF373 family)
MRLAGKPPSSRKQRAMLKLIHLVEGFIIRVLICLMLLAISLGTIELGRVLFSAIMSAPIMLLDITKLFDAFGLFLVILIGIELVKSMQFFLTENKIKPELVIEVAVIAVCNKVITLDLKHTEAGVLLGMSTLLIGLSASYFILQQRNVTDA